MKLLRQLDVAGLGRPQTSSNWTPIRDHGDMWKELSAIYSAYEQAHMRNNDPMLLKARNHTCSMEAHLKGDAVYYNQYVKRVNKRM